MPVVDFLRTYKAHLIEAEVITGVLEATTFQSTYKAYTFIEAEVITAVF